MSNEDEKISGIKANACHSVLPVSTLQRLAYIRFLWTIGKEQSRQPEPLSAVAVLSLHDTVELFLHLAAEHLNVSIGKRQRPEFVEYFGLIDKELAPDRLFQRAAMVCLNEARIALKHHGTLPARLAIEQLQSDVARFLDDNTPLIFKLAFESVSMVDLIAFEPARKSLKAAELELTNGDSGRAVALAAVAFAQLIDNYETEASKRYGRSPFVFGESYAFDSSSFRGAGRRPLYPHQQSQFEDKLMNSVIALQDAMKVLSLGIDYRRYAKFRLLTPMVRRNVGSDRYSIQNVANLRKQTWPPSSNACRFCFDFVIETAIRLQDFRLDPSDT